MATLGTALTPEHVRILKRGFAKKVYLLFDSDDAGIKAAHRGISVLINESVDAAVIVLPKGYDPDSYLLEFGSNAFQKISDKALGMVDFLVEAAIDKHGLSIEGKIRILSEISEPLSHIHDDVTRSMYNRYVAERLNINEAAVVEKVKSISSRNSLMKQQDDRRKHLDGRRCQTPWIKIP